MNLTRAEILALQPGPATDAAVDEFVTHFVPREWCQEAIDEDDPTVDIECLWHSDDPNDCGQIESGVSWKDCPFGTREATPAFSTDHAASAEVWDKMEAEGYHLAVYAIPHHNTFVCVRMKDNATLSEAETRQHAICIAALLRVLEMMEEEEGDG